MIGYEKLDSWKACHALALHVYKATKPLLKRDPELAERVRLAALLSAAKLARGVGIGNRKAFRYCAGLAAGHLNELAYHLKMVRVMELLPEVSCDELDALRGRAAFYVWKNLLGEVDLPEPEFPEGD
jgi:four helix bundle protein